MQLPLRARLGFIAAQSKRRGFNAPQNEVAPSHDATAAATIGTQITGTAGTWSGSPVLTYQWYKNTAESTSGGSAITGATSLNYTPIHADTVFGYYLYFAEIPDGDTGAQVFSNVSGEAVAAVPAAITPTLGSNLIVNAGLEGTYEDESGGAGGTVMVAPNWDNHTVNLAGLDTMTEEGTIIHGGSKSQKLIISTNGRGVKVPAISGAVGWKLYKVWVRTSGGSIRLADDNSKIKPTTTTTGTWINLIGTGRTNAINRYFLIACVSGAPATFYVDDAEAYSMDAESMFLTIADVGRKTGTYICHPTVAAQTQAGMAICYLDASNYLLVYVNRTESTVWLSRMLAGVWTETVISGAISYVAGAELKVTIAADGTTTVYYNTLQVGSPTVITNTALGTIVRAWNAYDGNGVGTVQSFLA